MKRFNGTIEIKPNFNLTNPTMESQGIKESINIYGFKLLNYFYLEIHFREPKDKLPHSRYWVIEDGVTEEEFITTHDVLKQFN